jgi:hypothetical protein
MARKNKNKTNDPLHGGTVHVPRSRGAVSGILLVGLGAWGALIPFVGPLFKFGYSPDKAWQWTAARGWLDVLPGAVVFIGALLLLLSANRITASFGGWLALAGGAWFIIGINCADLFHLGSVGAPLGSSKGQRLLENLTFFDGLGAITLFLAAGALGRLSIRSVRDVRAAQRREVDAEAEQQRQDAYAESRRRQLADRADHDDEPNSKPPYDSRIDRRDSAHDDSETTVAGPAGGSRRQAPIDGAPPTTGATAWDRRERS